MTTYPDFDHAYLDKEKMDSFDRIAQFHLDLLSPSMTTYEYYNQPYFHMIDNPPPEVTNTDALIRWLLTLPPPPPEPNLSDQIFSDNDDDEEEEEMADYMGEFGIIDEAKLDPVLEAMFSDFSRRFE